MKIVTAKFGNNKFEGFRAPTGILFSDGDFWTYNNLKNGGFMFKNKSDINLGKEWTTEMLRMAVAEKVIKPKPRGRTPIGHAWHYGQGRYVQNQAARHKRKRPVTYTQISQSQQQQQQKPQVFTFPPTQRQKTTRKMTLDQFMQKHGAPIQNYPQRQQSARAVLLPILAPGGHLTQRGVGTYKSQRNNFPHGMRTAKKRTAAACAEHNQRTKSALAKRKIEFQKESRIRKIVRKARNQAQRRKNARIQAFVNKAMATFPIRLN